MTQLGLEREIVDRTVYANTVKRFRERQITLPTFAQLAEPKLIPDSVWQGLAAVGPDAPDPKNLYRVHWYNDAARTGRVGVPDHIVIPEAFSGVPTPIVLLIGRHFPMINAHKVLAAYGCLAPRVVTGQFDPTRHRAVWPSTGNYCRGGVAISRIMASRGVAILPEQMSRERFAWLERWVEDPSDIIRTPGCESNVKEIYDKCNALAADPQNFIFNQFCEFANHLVHYQCTGKAMAAVYEHLRKSAPKLQLRAFVSATGSAGTIGAGDYLKDTYGTRIVAAEALECPTLLANGFGGHNIQGIGDKHVPFIHNVMNTDFVAAISDQATDALSLLCNCDVGQRYLRERRHLPADLVSALPLLGVSGICNLLAAIKTAKYLNLGPQDAIITVATDSAEMYQTERDKTLATQFNGQFDAINAGETFARFMLGESTAALMELTEADRNRVFNLGYFTWVEQQGVSLKDFEIRRGQGFWRGLRELLPVWDEMITAFNRETGLVTKAGK
jgi:cysteine synthase